MMSRVPGVLRLRNTKRGGASLLAVCLIIIILKSSGIAAFLPPVQYPQPGTLIINRAVAKGKTATGFPLPEVSAEVETIIPGCPFLKICKVDSPDPVARGEELIYTIHYENKGSAPASEVVITDYLSNHLIFRSASPGGQVTSKIIRRNTVSWNIGTVPPGGKGELTIVTKVKTLPDCLCSCQLPDLPCGLIYNTVFIKSQEGSWDRAMTLTRIAFPCTDIISDDADSPDAGGDLIADPNTLSHDTSDDPMDDPNTLSPDVSDDLITDPNNLPEPSLSVIFNGYPETVYKGNKLTYTMQVMNDGAIPLSNLVIRSFIPVNTVFISADQDGRLEGDEILWTIGELETGRVLTVHLVVQSASYAGEGESIENMVEVSSAEGAFQSALSATWLRARTQGEVEFLNQSFQPVQVFKSGDIIYLQVNDADRNADPNLVEIIEDLVVRQDESIGGSSIQNKRVSMGKEDYDDSDEERVILTETGPETGIFRGSLLTTLDSPVIGDGYLTVTPDSGITVIYTDQFDPFPVTQVFASIDPFGVVFDAITGAPVRDAVVTLIDNRTKLPAVLPSGFNPAQPTKEDGRFSFLSVPEGEYYLVVEAEDYTFPSLIPEDQLPEGFSMLNGSRGEVFTIKEDNTPLDLDLPVDPPTQKAESGKLKISKEVNTKTADIGDLITYTIKLAHEGGLPVEDIIIHDIMPHGVQYIKSSTRIKGIVSPDPESKGERTLTWTIPELTAGETIELAYRATVGVDSQRGDGKNTAMAEGISMGEKVASNSASCQITIKEGIFTSQGIILGKVFFYAEDETDRTIKEEMDGMPGTDSRHGEYSENLSFIEDLKYTEDSEDSKGFRLKGVKQTPGREIGIPKVMIYLENGSWVETDQDGKFSLFGISAGTHVLRLDETTLPEDMVLFPNSNRFMRSASSQFVDVPPGGLCKANFTVKKRKERGRAGDREREEQGNDGRSMDATSDPNNDRNDGRSMGTTSDPDHEMMVTGSITSVSSTGTDSDPDNGRGNDQGRNHMEELILTMTPDLDFLYPADGDLILKDQCRMIIKTPFGSELTLWVNNQKIGKERIGSQINHQAGGVSIYEFISVPLVKGERNILKTQIMDQFGNVRGRKEISILTAGEPARISILPDKKEIPANGISISHIAITVFDRNGKMVPYPKILTVETSAGEIMDQDLDLSQPGIQISRHEDGTARVSLKSSRTTGEAQIKVSGDGIKETAAIFFTPNLRDLFLTGFGEVTIGAGQTKGNFGYLKNNSWFDDRLYTGGKGAFFFKGKVAQDILLTAAYDSDKRKGDELFNRTEPDFEAVKNYTVFGDESRLGFEAQSRDRLYLKLEKNKSSLLYGDYHTELDRTKLSTYNRTFNGFKSEIEAPLFTLQSFASYTDQTQIMDALPGRGISGYYYLTSTPVIEGSERVVIETRDRLRPDRVLKREQAARESDYEVDYVMGTLLFKSPIPSRDADFNPVYIIVSYEAKTDGWQHYVYGGRGSFNLSKWLEIGLTGITEEKEADDYYLFGSDLTLKFPWKTTLKAEWAQTESIFAVENIYTPKKDGGWLVEMEAEPLKKLSLTGYYRSIGDYFGNPSANEVIRGTEKYGSEMKYRISSKARVWGKFFDEKDMLNHSKYEQSAAGIERIFGKTKIGLELSHETSHDQYIPVSSSPALVPFDISEETPEDVTSAKARIETCPSPKLAVFGEHKQDLKENQHNISHAGLEYRISKASKLYVRQEYGQYQERSEGRTILGGESAVAQNTSVFNESRLIDGSDGYCNQSSLGLRHKLKWGEKISGNMTLEKLLTLKGKEKETESDSLSATAGLDYLPMDKLKIDTRLEYRHEDEESTHLAELGFTIKVSQDYSLSLRERLFYDVYEEEGDHTTSHALLGLAYRPVRHDRFNALARIECKYDNNKAIDPDEALNAYISSLEGIFQLNKRTQLIGKYAGKLAQEDEYESYTDLLSGRVMFDITSRFDLGVQYRILQSHEVNTLYQGGSLEIGYGVVKNLWLSAGYCFDDFDTDLTGDSYRGEGPYLRLRFKFDESTIKRHQNGG